VLRRCPTPLTMLVATLACGLGLQPSLTQAASSSSSSVATYSFTTTVDLPPLTSQSTGPQIQFLVEPYGSLVYTPPTVNSAGVTTSPGVSPLVGTLSVTPALDSSNPAVVAVKTDQGSNEEFLGLAFANGLQSGSILKASLNYNTSQPPTLVPYETPGISTPTISTAGSQASGAGGSGGSGGGGVTTDIHTPEPLSLLIWAALAGGALARARFLRRSRRVALGG
jgi:hypothetical protein